jgi:hypothetical protein
MEIIGPVIVAPAITAFVFAIAFGARNPIRWAAWGAILGPIALILAFMAPTNKAPVAYAPTYTPTEEQPIQPAPKPPYKVPENEQVRDNGRLY